MANEEIKKEPDETKPLLGKVVIQGIMLCETGIHIGASKENLEIGRIDILVQRNPLTKEPYIPGSSLKGKMRSLLERIKQKEELKRTNTIDAYKFNRKTEAGKRHECDTINPECEVCRLFGSTGKKNHPARLIVRDLHFTNKTRDALNKIETGLLYTERKWENTLDRITAAATPRQIERVPAESEFFFELVYAVEKEADVKQDINNIFCTLSALELDALGGHGSRGYGKVNFRVIEVISLPPDGKLPRDFKALGKLVYDEDSIPKNKEKNDYEVCMMDLNGAKEKTDKVSGFFVKSPSGKES